MSAEEKYRAAYEYVFGSDEREEGEVENEEDDGNNAEAEDNADEGTDEYSSGTEFSATMDDCPDMDDAEELGEEEEGDADEDILDELAQKVLQARLNEKELDTKQVTLTLVLRCDIIYFSSIED